MPSALAVFACRPNSHPFQDRHVYLDEPVKIGRSVARCRPAQNNATFDCKVLSRNHALIWFDHKTGKVRTSRFCVTFTSWLITCFHRSKCSSSMKWFCFFVQPMLDLHKWVVWCPVLGTSWGFPHVSGVSDATFQRWDKEMRSVFGFSVGWAVVTNMCFFLSCFKRRWWVFNMHFDYMLDHSRTQTLCSPGKTNIAFNVDGSCQI